MTPYTRYIAGLKFLCDAEIKPGDKVVNMSRLSRGKAKATMIGPLQAFLVYNYDTPNMEYEIAKTEDIVKIVKQI